MTTYTSAGLGGHKSPSSRLAKKVYDFEYHLDSKRAQAPGCATSIQDVVANSEKNPRKKAALERARARIADQVSRGDGDTVKSLRLRKGWSQTTLSTLLGTSQSHVARIERGSENVTWETMRKLCDTLDVDMNTIDTMLQRQRSAFESSQK
ncbi:helix-turn-helix domain-containing protein [Halomonas halocynthiae]|uniref:helix-turn-helix domain-containing protein n=1 Tax=Halomonas halocynthiae TaxID=176290 RepID=UPI000686F1E3|nr:helix-turn-helix transcriptional regulator [Halomonas halocynthiae]